MVLMTSAARPPYRPLPRNWPCRAVRISSGRVSEGMDSPAFPRFFFLFAAPLAVAGLFAMSAVPAPALAAKHAAKHPAAAASSVPAGHVLSLNLPFLQPSLPAVLTLPAAVIDGSGTDANSSDQPQSSASASSSAPEATSSPVASTSATSTSPSTPIHASSTPARPRSGGHASAGASASVPAASVATTTNSAVTATSTVIAASVIPRQNGPATPAGDIYKADRLSPQTTFFVDMLAAFFAFLGLLLVQGFPDIEIRPSKTSYAAR